MFKYNSVIERAIKAAKNEAIAHKSKLVTDEMLLFSLYKEVQYHLAGKILTSNKFNLFTFRYYLDNKLEINIINEEINFCDVSLSDETESTLALADQYREKMQNDEINQHHLLLALLDSSNHVITEYFKDNDIAVIAAKQELAELIVTGKVKAYEKKPEVSNGKSCKANKVIEDLCIDLTAQAMAGKIDPIIGREQELEAIINTMARRTKNNVLLVADSGVGKTSVVKGLALKLANNEVPSLANKRIYSLSIGALAGGTQYRGQLEEKVTNLMKALSEQTNAILFIDEMHSLMKSGSDKNSSSDIMALLKAELNLRSIQLIGCTTTKEVRQIQEDPAMMRRLNVIHLYEPSEDEAFEIMKGLAYKYEEFHNVELPDETLHTAVKLAKRYVAERHLPDSAIDIIDSAAAKLKLDTANSNVSKVASLRNKLLYLEDDIINESDADSLLDLYIDYVKQQDLINEALEEETVHERPILTTDDIAKEVEVRTKIPVSRLMASDKAKLLHLEQDLHKQIVGQDKAIEEIANAIRRNSAGLSNPNKPIASFMFNGPTGVGKTAVVKALAELRFGSKDNIIRIDCSEYSESHSISKLIGSPVGYKGHEEGGQLTEAVRHKPHSVVLFDEFEKSQGNLNNLLLQIFDEGHLTDSHGVRVSFKNCIIVLTTNVGSSLIEQQTRSVGFGTTVNVEDKEQEEYELLKEKTMDAVKNRFAPEFLNRLSAIVVFHHLNKEQQRDIVRIMGKEIDTRLAEHNIIAKCSDEALDFITDKYYDKNMGARPLERGLVKEIEEPLSLLLLEDKIKAGDFIEIVLGDDKLEFKVREDVLNN